VALLHFLPNAPKISCDGNKTAIMWLRVFEVRFMIPQLHALTNKNAGVVDGQGELALHIIRIARH
jgi:hypothetical protein